MEQKYRIRPFLAKWNKTVRILIAILLGTIIFVAMFSAASLNPLHVNWMYARGGDSFQHQIGWLAFKNQPFSIQIGKIDNYPFPTGTSIVYTDSIPLFAVCFKLFAGILPKDFQYFGLFLLLCWILQIFFALEIFNQLKLRRSIQILGSVLLALSPVLIYRSFFHDALCAQWLILAGFLLWIKQAHGEKTIPCWIGLVCFSFWIHAYLFAMVTVMMIAAWITEGIRTKEWVSGFIGLGIMILFCSLSAWTLGMFTAYQKTPLEVFQNYSVNLNAFWNPFKTSFFFRQQGIAYDGQYEGYAYLGLGVIILLVSIFTAGINVIKQYQWSKYAIPIVSIVGLAILATGFSLSLGKSTLLSLSLPEFLQSPISTFRSMGRFIWPLYYGIIIWGIVTSDRLKFARSWIVVIILLQVVDILPLIESKSYIQINDYRSSLVSTFWEDEANSYKHIVFLPSDDIEKGAVDFSLYATKNEMTVNWAYLARGDYDAMNNSSKEAYALLLSGIIAQDSIYISWDQNQVGSLQEVGQPLYICHEKDHWLIFYKNVLSQDTVTSLDKCIEN
jgi:hypothetical protein